MYALSVGNYVSGCFNLPHLQVKRGYIKAPTSNAYIAINN